MSDRSVTMSTWHVICLVHNIMGLKINVEMYNCYIIMSINVVIMIKGHDDLSIFSVVWLQKNSDLSNCSIIMFTCHVIVFIGYVDWSILSVVRLKNKLYCHTVVSLCLYTMSLCSFHILTGRLAVLFG